MFAVFEVVGKRRIKASHDFGNPVSVRDLCKRMNEQKGDRHYRIRQKVKLESDLRGKWKDL